VEDRGGGERGEVKQGSEFQMGREKKPLGSAQRQGRKRGLRKVAKVRKKKKREPKVNGSGKQEKGRRWVRKGAG